MFRSGLKSQGKFLVQMMTMTLQLANQEQKFMEAMLKLAEVHNNRGVKAIECKELFLKQFFQFFIFIHSYFCIHFLFGQMVSWERFCFTH